jgi:signal transduction histidine kinase
MSIVIETAATKPGDLKNHTILIIEDNPNNLGVIVEYLEDAGFKIAIARNGEIGLKRAQFAKPNIILLDVMMPTIDGFETCRRLKADEQTRDIPVIFMTALDSPEDKLKGFEVGGVDYITKPIQHEEVLARVTTHLRIRELTIHLNAKVDELTQTRKKLIQSEKMASLGRLVAGFAHELNTPLGIAIGSTSAQIQEIEKIHQLMGKEEIDVDELLSALDGIDKGANLTLSNLERLVNLVTSFKRTAIDQTSDEIRTFDVEEVIQEAINTLYSHFKATQIAIEFTCAKDIKINSLPGALKQIITHLLINSLIHGFNEGQQAGVIKIKVKLIDGQQLHIEYSDNGTGIPSENLEKIFEPFFTTHRTHAGSGLGMYICYNLVTTQLSGTISCDSTVNNGVKFQIDYPV